MKENGGLCSLAIQTWRLIDSYSCKMFCLVCFNFIIISYDILCHRGAQLILPADVRHIACYRSRNLFKVKTKMT
jgi:hypothetical protein